jgi:enamine deaminase RidA (YjgF/YER057c/UK114 family)
MTRRSIDVDKPFQKALPFAQGVVVEGELLFTSGITARDENGEVVGVGDLERQFGQCFGNIADIFEAAGTNFDHLVKVIMYTTDIRQCYEFPNAWRQYFGARPASTLVEVSALAHPDMMLEIEAVARIP